MKKELGKWLIDISKYILAAIILLCLLGATDQNSKTGILIGIPMVIFFLVIGFWLTQNEIKRRG